MAANRRTAPSGDRERSWPVDTGRSRGNFAKATMAAMLFLAAVPVLLMLSGLDLHAYRQVMTGYGVFVLLGFGALCYLPFLFRKKDTGRVRLHGKRLRFEGGSRSEDLWLDETNFSLFRVVLHDHFLGTLLTAHSSRTGRTVHLFSGGAEVPPQFYERTEANYRTDSWTIPRRYFRELFEELEARTHLRATNSDGAPGAGAPDTESASPPALAAQPRNARDGRATRNDEQVFEARAPSSSGGLFGLAFLPFLVMVGSVAATKISWTKEPLTGLLVLALIAALAAVPTYLVVRGLRARRQGRLLVRVTNELLVVESARGQLFRAGMPPRVFALTWRNHWIHRHRYTLGAAIRVTNESGQSATFGVWDPPSAPRGAPRTSKVDYILSADAGESLLQRLGTGKCD